MESPQTYETTKSYADKVRIAREGRDVKSLVFLAKEVISGKIFDDGSIAKELVQSLDVPIELAKELAMDWNGEGEWDPNKASPHLGNLICKRPDATAAILDEWSGSNHHFIIHAVAKHPNTSLKTLEKLLVKQNIFAPALALANVKVPLRRVDSLVDHSDPSVRTVVAKRTQSRDILRLLAKNPEETVRVTVMQNSVADIEMIEMAALHDKNLKVVASATTRLAEDAILEKVALRLANEDWEESSLADTDTLANAIGSNERFHYLSDKAKSIVIEVKLKGS